MNYKSKVSKSDIGPLSKSGVQKVAVFVHKKEVAILKMETEKGEFFMNLHPVEGRRAKRGSRRGKLTPKQLRTRRVSRHDRKEKRKLIEGMTITAPGWRKVEK